MELGLQVVLLIHLLKLELTNSNLNIQIVSVKIWSKQSADRKLLY